MSLCHSVGCTMGASTVCQACGRTFCQTHLQSFMMSVGDDDGYVVRSREKTVVCNVCAKAIRDAAATGTIDDVLSVLDKLQTEGSN